MSRVLLVVAVLGCLVFGAQGAAAESDGPRCRSLTILRLNGVIYFHHRLKVDRPARRSSQGIGMERACDDTPDPAEPPPWYPTAVYALDGINPSLAVAPARRQVLFYDIYKCTPRFGEARFLRCLRRR